MHSGRVVIMDSGFCVLKSLAALSSVGIFALEVMKKRRFWPKYIDGDDIEQRFNGYNVGRVESLPGCLDGVAFKIFS